MFPLSFLFLNVWNNSAHVQPLPARNIRSRLPGVFRTQLSQLNIRAGKRNPSPLLSLSTAAATAAARVNETIPAAREMPKAWARIFFPPFGAGHFRGCPHGGHRAETRKNNETNKTNNNGWWLGHLRPSLEVIRSLSLSLSLSLVLADRVLPRRRLLLLLLRAGGYFNCILIFLINCN